MRYVRYIQLQKQEFQCEANSPRSCKYISTKYIHVSMYRVVQGRDNPEEIFSQKERLSCFCSVLYNVELRLSSVQQERLSTQTSFCAVSYYVHVWQPDCPFAPAIAYSRPANKPAPVPGQVVCLLLLDTPVVTSSFKTSSLSIEMFLTSLNGSVQTKRKILTKLPSINKSLIIQQDDP